MGFAQRVPIGLMRMGWRSFGRQKGDIDGKSQYRVGELRRRFGGESKGET